MALARARGSHIAWRSRQFIIAMWSCADQRIRDCQWGNAFGRINSDHKNSIQRHWSHHCKWLCKHWLRWMLEKFHSFCRLTTSTNTSWCWSNASKGSLIYNWKVFALYYQQHRHPDIFTFRILPICQFDRFVNLTDLSIWPCLDSSPFCSYPSDSRETTFTLKKRIKNVGEDNFFVKCWAFCHI